MKKIYFNKQKMSRNDINIKQICEQIGLMWIGWNKLDAIFMEPAAEKFRKQLWLKFMIFTIIWKMKHSL